MEISNQVYDVSKWFVLVFLPALAVLASGLGEQYGWSDTVSVVASLNLIAAFLGTVLQLSSQNYHGGNQSGGGNIGTDRLN